MSLWTGFWNLFSPSPSKPAIDTVEQIRRTTTIILYAAERALIQAYPQGSRQWNRELNMREMTELGRTTIQIVCTNTLYESGQVQYGIWVSFFLVGEKPLTYEVEATDSRFRPEKPLRDIELCAEISQALLSVGLGCIVRPGRLPR